MKNVKIYLIKFVKYLLTIRPPVGPVLEGIIHPFFYILIMTECIADDVLFEILGVIHALVCNKFFRPLSYGFFGFLILEYVACISFVVATNQWNLFLTQYGALIAGSLVVRQQSKN